MDLSTRLRDRVATFENGENEMGSVVLVVVAVLIGWFAVGWGWPLWLAAIVGGGAAVVARFLFNVVLGASLVGYANHVAKQDSSNEGGE